MKRALTLLALLAMTLPCTAAPYSGATTPMPATGYAWNQGQLFAIPSPTLTPPTLPLAISYNIKTNVTSVPGGTTQSWIDGRGGLATAGVFIGSGLSGAFGAPFTLSHYLPLATSTACQVGSENCARPSLVNDGNWHNVCWNVTPGGSQLYVDSLMVDNNILPAPAYTPMNATWIIGPGKMFAGQFRDIRVYNTSIGELGCEQLGLLALQGLTPSGGYLQDHLASHWPLNNCDATGCLDTSGNGNNLLFNNTPPVCAITAPVNGATALKGAVSLQGSCTSLVAISKIQWLVDGAYQGVSTTAPYTIPWDSTKYLDGPHTITLATFTIDGQQATVVTSTVSTNNGGIVANKTIYYDPVAGNNANTCLSVDSPCLNLAGVQAKINASPLHEGDSILQKAGTNLNLNDLTTASTLSVAGPLCSASLCNVNQNAFPGNTITFGTYGGTGQCQILAGITADCASITLAANGAVTRNGGVLNFFNIPNLVLQNMRIFVGQPNAQLCPSAGGGCNNAVRYSFLQSILAINTTNAITNNEFVDGWRTLYIAGALDPGHASNANECGTVTQDNYVHGSTVQSHIATAIYVEEANCVGFGQDPSLNTTVSSNYVTNTGGTNGEINESGSGILLANGILNIVDNYNVTIGGAYWSNTCGASYGNWWYQSRNINVKGNESANHFPRAPGGCDKGAFDFDNGTSNGIFEFNYAHTTWGPSVGGFNAAVGSYPQENFIIAYNTFENGQAQDNQGLTSMVFFAGGGGPDVYYNNNIWNGYVGHMSPLGIFYTWIGAMGYGQGCPAVNPSGPNLSVNNIVVADTYGPRGAMMAIGGLNSVGRNCNTMTFKNNDYWPLGTGKPYFQNILTTANYIGVAAWNAASGDTGIQVNPGFTGGTAVNCYTAGSGVPVQPGTIPCPTNYQLSAGNALIGAGLDLRLSPYSLTPPSQDYYGNALPHGIGTGFDFGAGGHH